MEYLINVDNANSFAKIVFIKHIFACFPQYFNTNYTFTAHEKYRLKQVLEFQ